jgi:hypothetical protein
MKTFPVGVAIVLAGVLAACSDGIGIGGAPQDPLQSEMLSADPMDDGEIDDATGTMIP